MYWYWSIDTFGLPCDGFVFWDIPRACRGNWSFRIARNLAMHRDGQGNFSGRPRAARDHHWNQWWSSWCFQWRILAPWLSLPSHGLSLLFHPTTTPNHGFVVFITTATLGKSEHFWDMSLWRSSMHSELPMIYSIIILFGLFDCIIYNSFTWILYDSISIHYR